MWTNSFSIDRVRVYSFPNAIPPRVLRPEADEDARPRPSSPLPRPLPLTFDCRGPPPCFRVLPPRFRRGRLPPRPCYGPAHSLSQATSSSPAPAAPPLPSAVKIPPPWLVYIGSLFVVEI